MAKHFTYSVFLDKSQGLHSPIYSEPERPVTKVILIPRDWGWGLSGVWGLPSTWGVSEGTHVCAQTSPVLPPSLAVPSSLPRVSGERAGKFKGGGCR